MSRRVVGYLDCCAKEFRQLASTTWLEGVGAKIVWSVMQIVRLRLCLDVDAIRLRVTTRN